MQNLVIRLVIIAAAIYVTVLIVPGITLGEGPVDVARLLVVALIFGLVNALIKPIVKFFTCPVYVLTLGLFTFIVNGAMLMLASWIAQQMGNPFSVASFLDAVIGGFLISVVSFVLSIFLSDSKDD
jgi:putative membrane protein